MRCTAYHLNNQKQVDRKQKGMKRQTTCPLGLVASINSQNINFFNYEFAIQKIKTEYAYLNSLSIYDIIFFLA